MQLNPIHAGCQGVYSHTEKVYPHLPDSVRTLAYRVHNFVEKYDTFAAVTTVLIPALVLYPLYAHVTFLALGGVMFLSTVIDLAVKQPLRSYVNVSNVDMILLTTALSIVAFVISYPLGMVVSGCMMLIPLANRGGDEANAAKFRTLTNLLSKHNLHDLAHDMCQIALKFRQHTETRSAMKQFIQLIGQIPENISATIKQKVIEILRYHRGLINFTDMESYHIKLGQQTHTIAKFLVKLLSPLLYNSLEDGIIDPSSKTLNIPAEESIKELFIRYLQLENIASRITAQDVEKLLELAHYCHADLLEAQCVEFINKILNPSNLTHFLEIAHTKKSINLLLNCFNYIKDHSAEIDDKTIDELKGLQQKYQWGVLNYLLSRQAYEGFQLELKDGKISVVIKNFNKNNHELALSVLNNKTLNGVYIPVALDIHFLNGSQNLELAPIVEHPAIESLMLRDLAALSEQAGQKLAHNTTLKKFFVSSFQPSPELLELLFNALKSQASIVELGFFVFLVEGRSRLVDILSQNTAITKLHVADNQLRDFDATLLQQMHIKELSVYSEERMDTWLNKLATHIPAQTSLRSLILSGTPLTYAKADDILQICEKCPSIRLISIDPHPTLRVQGKLLSQSHVYWNFLDLTPDN